MTNVGPEVKHGLRWPRSHRRDRDEQRTFVKCNHIVANRLSFHTLVTMTKALQRLLQEGGTIDIDALSTLSPYRTWKLCDRFQSNAGRPVP